MVRPRWIAAIFIANVLATLAGCRTTRPEVPPPPRFAADGRKIGSNVVGFGSTPRAGYMTDASTQTGPGVAAPGGDRTSIASSTGPKDSATSTFPGDAPPSTRGTPLATPNNAGSVAGAAKPLGVGGIFNGLGSSTKAKKDDAVVTAGSTDASPPVAPLDPPVSMPPPPLVPPPSGVAPPALPVVKDQTGQSPSALPPESAIPPVVPEQSP